MDCTTPWGRYFVGSIESTYSQLIANAVGWGNAVRNASADGVYWVPAQKDGKYYHSLVGANACPEVEAKGSLAR